MDTESEKENDPPPSKKPKKHLTKRIAFRTRRTMQDDDDLTLALFTPFNENFGTLHTFGN